MNKEELRILKRAISRTHAFTKIALDRRNITLANQMEEEAKVLAKLCHEREPRCPHDGCLATLEFAGDVAAPGYGRSWTCLKCENNFWEPRHGSFINWKDVITEDSEL